MGSYQRSHENDLGADRACAPELGWAPGTEKIPGRWAALKRQSSAQEQLLCKGRQGQGHGLQVSALKGEESEREVRGRPEWEDAEMWLEEKSGPPLTW